MTPLQALLAHASPDAPFEQFAGYILDGSWTLDGDDQGEGILASGLDAAKYTGNDAKLLPLVSALIQAGARLPRAPSPGDNLYTFQAWRNRLPMCSLLVNLTRAQTPVEQACKLISVIEEISRGDRTKIKDMVQETHDKASALGGGDAGRFWAAPVQGLSTLSFLAAAALTSPPCGIYNTSGTPDGIKVMERRSKTLSQIINANPRAASTDLEVLLCQLLMDYSRPQPDSPTPEQLAKMSWNRLAPTEEKGALQDWILGLQQEISALPRLTRVQSCCAILDGISIHARQDPVARELFQSLLPLVSTLQKQEMKSMMEEGQNLSAAVTLRLLSQQMKPDQDINAAMHAWMAMSKVSMPAVDRREFSEKMLLALASATPDQDILDQALNDVEFFENQESRLQHALQSLRSSMDLQQGTVSRHTPSRPSSRI